MSKDFKRAAQERAMLDLGEPGYFQLPIGAGKTDCSALEEILKREREVRESQVDMSRKIASNMFEQHVHAIMNHVEGRLRTQLQQIDTLNRVTLRLEQQLDKSESEIDGLKKSLEEEIAKRNKYNRFEAMDIE